MDKLEQLREDVRLRKLAQNERRAKKGRKPMHPELARKPKKKRSSKLPAPESGNEEDSALSFEEWKEVGYVVKHGEKSQLQDIHGVPQFTRLQVHKINPAWEHFRQRNS